MGRPGRTLGTRISLPIAVLAVVLVCGCGAGGGTDDAARGAAKIVGIGSDDAGKVFPKFKSQLDNGAPPALGDDAGRGAAASARARQLFEESVKTALCEGFAIYHDYGRWPTSAEWYEIIEDRTRAYNPTYGQIYRLVSGAENLVIAVTNGDIPGARLELFCA